MLLHQSQITFYQTNGYLHVPDIFQQKDLDLLRNLVNERVDEFAHEIYKKGTITSLYSDQPFEHRLAYLYKESQTGIKIWEIRDQVLHSQNLYLLLCNIKLTEVIKSLLGPEIAWTGSFAIRNQLPEEKHPTYPWHQDSQYYGKDTQHLEIISVWIPLVNVDEKSGSLFIIPGSQKWGLLEGNRMKDRIIRTTENVEARGTPICLSMNAGDILLFSNLTFHASKLNTSDSVRWSADIRYVAPAKTEGFSQKEQQGYNALYNHYKMKPIPIHTDREQNIQTWKKI